MSVVENKTLGREAVIGAIGLVSLGIVAVMLQRRKAHSPHPQPLERRRALIAYLRDHLSGADAVIQVVGRLSHQREGTSEGSLFASLREQLGEERSVVEALLMELGASAGSVKRLAGQATGRALKAVGGEEPGELALFRTLEGLCVGVQGKRCLWRTLETLAPSLRAPGGPSFTELESRAVSQWEQIEQCRRSLVRQTFSARAVAELP